MRVKLKKGAYNYAGEGFARGEIVNATPLDWGTKLLELERDGIRVAGVSENDVIEVKP